MTSPSASSPTTADVGAHYDTLDPFYRRLWGEHLHHGLWERGDEDVEQAVAALVDRVADVARIARGSAVCDVGCGYGATASRLTTRYGARVVGFTVSSVQAAHAARLSDGPDAPRIVCRDWLDNDLPSESFDAVIALESTEHIADRKRFYAEAARVLRPGGRLVVCAWLVGDAPRPWQKRWLLEPMYREGQVAPLGTAADHLGWMTRAGFADVTHDDVTAQVRRTWIVASYRLLAAVSTDRGTRTFLLNGPAAHRVFALSVLRICAAYAVGAMKYGLFAATK